MSGESVSYFLLRRTPAYILADDIFAGLNTILVTRGFKSFCKFLVHIFLYPPIITDFHIHQD